MDLPYRLLADAVLALHAAFAGFVVLGQGMIVVGWAAGWRWTRGVLFRLLHLAAACFVALQAWLGAECPLTTVENELRLRAGEEGYAAGFVADWLHRILFYSAAPEVFTVAYTLFAAAVLATWACYPPRRRPAAKGRA